MVTTGIQTSNFVIVLTNRLTCQTKTNLWTRNSKGAYLFQPNRELSSWRLNLLVCAWISRIDVFQTVEAFFDQHILYCWNVPSVYVLEGFWLVTLSTGNACILKPSRPSELKGELGQLDTAGARSISDFGSRNVISGRCTTPDGLRDIKHRKNDPTDAVGSPGYPVDRPILPISISDFWKTLFFCKKKCVLSSCLSSPFKLLMRTCARMLHFVMFCFGSGRTWIQSDFCLLGSESNRRIFAMELIPIDRIFAGFDSDRSESSRIHSDNRIWYFQNPTDRNP